MYKSISAASHVHQSPSADATCISFADICLQAVHYPGQSYEREQAVTRLLYNLQVTTFLQRFNGPDTCSWVGARMGIRNQVSW